MGADAVAAGLRRKDPEVVGRILSAYGIGTTLALALPFSRKQESEADRTGLIYMAKAGYDPRQAISFRQRMSKSGAASPTEFLATHPGYETRTANLLKWMPEAVEYYEKSRKAPDRPIRLGGKR